MYKSYTIGKQFILTIGKVNSVLADFSNKKIYHIKNILSDQIVNRNLHKLPNQLSNIFTSDIVSDMEEIRNYSFSKDFLYSSSKLWLDITNICNLRCKGCYAVQYMKDIKRRYVNANIIEKVADIGYMFHSIHLLGGEPLLHSSLRDILEKFIPKFDIITIYTNGHHVTDDILLLLKSNANIRLKISLYGINSGDHDNFTQRIGSFDITMRSIIKCNEHGIRPKVAYLITNTARERDVNRIQKFLDSINVDYGIDIERSSYKSAITFDNCDDYKSHDKFFNFKRKEQYISNLFFHDIVPSFR